MKVPVSQRGFSLIELMVSMAIALVLTLAITTVMITAEGDRRTNSSVNDMDQTGAYVGYRLDRIIRSAGSGFSQNRSSVWGCPLDVKKSGTQVLPPTGFATTSAFASWTSALLPIRLAPVIIAKDLNGSTRGDVIMVMAGAAGFAEASRTVVPTSITSGQLLFTNNLGYATDDVFLLQDPAVPAGCMLQQVGSLPPLPSTRTDLQTVPLAGPYYTTTGTLASLTSYGANTIALQMGNAGTATQNLPQFQLIGVGANNTLYAYDLLQASSTPEMPIADSVAELHALYGVDTDVDGDIDAWVVPGSAGYDPATLLGSSDALRKIVAIRVGIILRSPYQERNAVSVGTPDTTLFADLLPANTAAKYTMPSSRYDPTYRYRSFEYTIPLRNVMLAP